MLEHLWKTLGEASRKMLEEASRKMLPKKWWKKCGLHFKNVEKNVDTT
jgi:hypothetical protein